VDTIIEFRRYRAADPKDRKRVLNAFGRWDETPAELVVELTDQGYTAQGDRKEVNRQDLVLILRNLLPDRPPGWTDKETAENWPTETAPRHAHLAQALRHGAEMGLWTQGGAGSRGSPFRYFRP
jgi:hypothetical protein